ncbi:MAG: DUF1116 domain-containing protein [Candidatus Aureabacteria bacterium]|nr:DUF1116 domain-containing protein [Candidatus Auribacterota bacterium]
MTKLSDLFSSKLSVINLGLESFADSVKSQGVDVEQVDWKPPAGGDPTTIALLDALDRPALKARIEAANQKAATIMIGAQPVLIDILPAREAIPGMKKNLILHAGPPVAWERMCGPVRGAVLGALIYEKMAASIPEAEKLAASGKIEFAPCHHHRAVGPMAGVVSSSMFVYVVKNQSQGNAAYCTLNEGLGKVLRFGAYGEDVIKRLKWMETVLAPSLRKAVQKSGGINIKDLTARALMMGDECHNRNVAATSLFIRELVPHLLATDLDQETIRQVVLFLSANDHTFLNLSMAACKATTDPLVGMQDSSLVSAMARNGTEIGIRIAALGERWFTAPAGMPKGLYFPGFSEKDSNPDLGDSTVSEVAGIGGSAMAAAPAIVKFVGGTAADAVRFTKEMYEITTAEHTTYLIPGLNFRGTPIGIDIRKVADLNLPPFINTGIAHKNPGVGQIGAGLLRAPMECFREALAAFAVLFEK